MNRKRSICLLTALLLTVCFVLSACNDPPHDSLNYSELLEEVVQVEMIEYNNPDQRRIRDTWPKWARKPAKFDTEQVTVQGKLDETLLKDFFLDLSDMLFLYEYFNTDSPRGKCLRLTCENGDFLILSPGGYLNNDYYGYAGRYSADGTPISIIGTYDSIDIHLLFVKYFDSV